MAGSQRDEFRFTCRLRQGLHARPASLCSDLAKRFASTLTLRKESGGDAADMRSVLSLVGLDVKLDDVCVVTAAGPDAAQALQAVRDLVNGRLAEGDEDPVATHATPREAKLPHALRAAGLAPISGLSVSDGFAMGEAVILGGLTLPASVRDAKPASIAAEVNAAQHAIAAVRTRLRDQALKASGLEAAVLGAHVEIAGDPALAATIEAAITQGLTAPQGVTAAGEKFCASLRAAASEYIRDRVLDVQDVCLQLLEHLLGPAAGQLHPTLAADSIVFAESLTPGQLLALDRTRLKGLVLGRIGATSHTVILARSHRLPAIIDVASPAASANAGETVLLDAARGFALRTPSDHVLRHYAKERAARAKLHEALAPLAMGPATTADGVRLEVGINAATAPEVQAGIEQGADGVGLLRTELLFLDRDAAPDEEEQTQAYAAVVKAAKGGPSIIRTFDIGGDKPAKYLAMPHEENPFLGVRGLRLYPLHEGLLRTQLRAILRASSHGPVKIMAPMVATATEARWFRERVEAAKSELTAEGVAFDAATPVGVMLEIPAAVFAIRDLAREVNFFSVGTNDLCQYAMAVDRGNADVAPLYDTRTPAFLRLLAMAAREAKAAERWIGLCGEMGSDSLNLPIMIGLGLDEISVAPGEAMRLKARVREADATRCRELLEACLACVDSAAVESLLRSGAWRSDQGKGAKIIETSLIAVASDAADKAEAIGDAVRLLLAAGRTQSPDAVEEAVWAREATYSTGLGHGFAIPHCKTHGVDRPTLAVMKLAQPIEWGSMDGLPVSTVLLLAIPASDTTGSHMKIFAKLARKLMHESFRESLNASTTPDSVLETLSRELEL